MTVLSIKHIILVLMVGVCGLLTIRARTLHQQTRLYVFKPMTMGLIIAIVLFNWHGNGTGYQLLILAGLAFSLAGDLFLMFPSDNFKRGLICFLFAHIIYTAAFSIGVGLQVSMWIVFPFIIAGILIYRLLLPFLAELRYPVLIYVFAITVMGWRAFEQWNHTGSDSAMLASLGAVLFLVSDYVLALNRFRKEIQNAQPIILSAYFTAQTLIAFSAV